MTLPFVTMWEDPFEYRVQSKLTRVWVQGLQPGEKLGVGSLVLAGGVAGVAYWGPVCARRITLKMTLLLSWFASYRLLAIIS